MSFPLPTSSEGSSRAFAQRPVRWALLALRETLWFLKEAPLCLTRLAGLAWSRVRQRQLEARRRRMLRSLGEEIRHGSELPDSLRPLLRKCDAYEQVCNALREALLARTARAGWLSRARKRVQLSRAQSEWSAALQKLGDEGRSLVPLERQEAFRAIEAAAIGEQARQARLREPWQALSSTRRAAIWVFATLLAAAGLYFLAHSATATRGIQPANTYARKSVNREADVPSPKRSKDQAAGVSRKARAGKEKSQRPVLDFAQQRQAASPGQWVAYGGNPVLLRGERNQWDDYKVGSPVVLKEGGRYRMWYRGCHFLGADYTCGIGHAASADGVSWEKSPEPVFVPQDPHEIERLSSVAVVRAGDQYWMWYAVEANPFADRPHGAIYLVTSKDGLAWQSAGPVLRDIKQRGGPLEISALYDGKLFHLWYADHPSGDDRALMHVVSTDGAQWQTLGSTPVASLKSQFGKLSVLADSRGGYRALFSYARDEQSKAGVFGMLLSSDGTQWRPADREMKLAPREAGLGRGTVAGSPTALAASNELWIWFSLRPDNGAEQIGLALLKE